MLAHAGLPAGQLELEVTESTILTDPFPVRSVIDRLNELGLGLAINDFGTGYSSLAHLKQLPVLISKPVSAADLAAAARAGRPEPGRAPQTRRSGLTAVRSR